MDLNLIDRAQRSATALLKTLGEAHLLLARLGGHPKQRPARLDDPRARYETLLILRVGWYLDRESAL